MSSGFHLGSISSSPYLVRASPDVTTPRAGEGPPKAILQLVQLIEHLGTLVQAAAGPTTTGTSAGSSSAPGSGFASPPLDVPRPGMVRVSSLRLVQEPTDTGA
ncbi:unnamed protein product [Nezara viridula]|uniref:Uncharacterized protein n=1 Tax=Nezara viridula TaxID=85310 RepID=A0A9P0H8W7_NEZVI|nr:unnamed protein product [Nezara viridula]